jgi:hypothetical protein
MSRQPDPSIQPAATRASGGHHGGDPDTRAQTPYVQVSIQRPPRTTWERIRSWFGARFFDVETRRGAGPVGPAEDALPTPRPRAQPDAPTVWQYRRGLAE